MKRRYYIMTIGMAFIMSCYIIYTVFPLLMEGEHVLFTTYAVGGKYKISVIEYNGGATTGYATVVVVQNKTFIGIWGERQMAFSIDGQKNVKITSNTDGILISFDATSDDIIHVQKKNVNGLNIAY